MREWFQWVLLAAALAVPVLFFWNWKQKMTASAPAPSPSPGARTLPAAAPAAPVRKPPPPAGGGWSEANPSTSERVPPAPAAVSTASAAVPAPPPASAAVQASPSETSPRTAVPRDVSGATAAPSATLPGPGPKAPQPAAGLPGSIAPIARTAAPKSRVTYSPKTDRDPMLSLFELEKLLAKDKEKKEGPKAKVVKKPPEPPIETRIQLSGTMRMGSEIVAYVNDQIVRVGSNVLGAKVVKITEAAVVFEYKGRRFARTVRE